MPSLRIVAAGASLLCFSLCFSLLAAGGAGAQSAAPGKPIQLLPTLRHAEKTKAKTHAGRIGRRLGKIHFAAAKRKLNRAQETARTETARTETAKAETARAETARAETARAETARAALPTNIWPGLGNAAPTEAAAAEPPLQAASASAEPVPSELVVGGRTVQVVSPNDANELDLAAAPPQAEKTVVVARAQAETSPVGSASWMAQVLAALGGAVAAGSLAWFLIGSAPQRTYG